MAGRRDNPIFAQIRAEQEERYLALDAEFLTAGFLLERAGISEWSPSQATEKVREIRCIYSQERQTDNSDLLSGVGCTAIKHLVEKGLVAGRQLPENPNLTIFHTVPEEPSTLD